MGRLLLTVVLALTLSGCIANPEPAPLPGTEAQTEKPTETAAPTTAPSEPVATRTSELPATSPENFAREYFIALNKAMRTGDTEAVRLLTTTSCAGCVQLSSRIEQIYGAGGRIETAGWRIREITMVEAAPIGRPVLEITVTLGKQAVTAAADRPEQIFPGTREAMTMHLVGHSGSWYVDRLELTL